MKTQPRQHISNKYNTCTIVTSPVYIWVQGCLDSIISILAISTISRHWLVPVAEQVGLSLTWSQSPNTGILVTWLE